MSENHFYNVVKTLQATPKAARPGTLITEIAKQMAQSSNQQVQQWGQDLIQAEPQLVSALQQ